MLKTGIYEQVIDVQLRKELEAQTDRLAHTAPIDEAEAAKVLSQYTADVIEKSLLHIMDRGADLHAQIALINKIIHVIEQRTDEDLLSLQAVDKKAEQLLALIEKSNSLSAIGRKADVVRPETSIAQSSLFTGAVHEPNMMSELKKEILSSDRIDMLVSFIKWSGLRLLMDELRTFTQRGGQLRVITTSYMGATDAKAIEELQQLPNTHIKVSYDTKRTRLHAKAYVFYRNTGFTTAYVGSSNLSNAAISSGLEWNIKVTAKDQPETIKKIAATFESYWNSNEFEQYSDSDHKRLEQALRAEKHPGADNNFPFLFTINPYPYQQEILDQLDAERKVRNRYKNLVVAATGTGKTVISAFDYKRFCNENQARPNRLLFVAHREEILKQSHSCFQGILRDPNFGELYVGNHRPQSIDHLFVSIQTFYSQSLHEKLSPDFYDYIVVDEFHHAAAPTYQNLLTHFKPKVLLGLTATPERMDGKDILDYFDQRIAAEIRLPEAIERKLLCPFQYFGVSDTVDLDTLRWTRGGYDRNELTRIYTLERAVAQRRADQIIRSLQKYVTDIDDVKGLGFCVSVEHARFMSEFFNAYGIPSIHLTGQSPDEERSAAKQKLAAGDICMIFVVDIYNEGVDIPQINTILFLRPTESLTVFLQQLGRGLRLWEGKECLTVLDFIGQANRKYNFEEKFAALLTHTTQGVQREISNDFISVPKGCYIQLEKKAKDINIRNSFGLKAGLVSRIASFTEDTGHPLSIEHFLDYYHMDIRHIYMRDSFSRLCVLAGVKEDFYEPLETAMAKAFTRICAIDSRRWILFLLDTLPRIDKINMSDLTDGHVRMLQMLHYTIWQKPVEECGFSNVQESLTALKSNPVLFSELLELLTCNFNRIDFIDEPMPLGFDCPLDLHCTYTRDQILVAMDFMKPHTVREGVKYLPEKQIDLFFITLNKSDKEYSPTTMYNDYSINETLFHWQSQSTTSQESSTGKRYIHHRSMGSKVLFFVREYKKDIIGTAPYTFLGLVDYLYHDGSRPMNIVWKMHRPIPAKYLKKTNKLVVG